MKTSVVWAAALMLALSGCKKKEDQPTKPATDPALEQAKAMEQKPAEVKPVEKKLMTGEEIAARYKECMAAFSAHDEAKFVACFSEETVSEILDSGQPAATGAKAMGERAKGFWAGVPDVKDEPQLILINGNNVAAIDLVTGTNSGEFMGQPPTNKKVGYHMTHLGEIDPVKGTWTKVHALMDMMTVAGQMSGDKRARKVEDKSWADAPRVVVAKNDPTETSNAELWNKGAHAWNSHDAAKATADYADDAVFHDASAGDIAGKKKIADHMKGFWAAFSDIKGSYDKVWGAGDYVVATGTVTGTNDGNMPAMNLKKTGKTVTMKTVEFARLEGGKVKEHWIFYNGMAMAQQLGMAPPGGAAPKK